MSLPLKCKRFMDCWTIPQFLPQFNKWEYHGMSSSTGEQAQKTNKDTRMALSKYTIQIHTRFSHALDTSWNEDITPMLDKNGKLNNNRGWFELGFTRVPISISDRFTFYGWHVAPQICETHNTNLEDFTHQIRIVFHGQGNSSDKSASLNIMWGSLAGQWLIWIFAAYRIA